MIRRLSVFLSKKPSQAYHDLVIEKKILIDENQIRALPVFDRLYEDLVNYTERFKLDPPPKRQVELRPPNRLGIISSFFRTREQEAKVSRALASIDSHKSNLNVSYHPLSAIKGLYVWGGVGCGKTMLMDLLYDNAPAELKKMRIHFHQFMLDVQKTTHEIRFKSQKEKNDINNRANDIYYNIDANRRRTPEAEINIFDELAQRFIGHVELLCFDEVTVSDIAHAMILKRLFNSFYRIGVVVIFTSNRPPDELYFGGLNRGDFLPFIDLVKSQNVVYSMLSDIDHRLGGSATDTYLTPFNSENQRKFDKLYLDMCKSMPSGRRVLKVFGRDVIIPRACNGVCYFYFNEICGTDMSSADYEVIAKNFHTVFINGLPRFPYENTNIKSRFLLLIDALYNYCCKVVIYAQTEPALLQDTKDEALKALNGNEANLDQLSEFERESGKSLIDSADNSFQMERCISRLCEMRSKEYLSSQHKFEDVDLST